MTEYAPFSVQSNLEYLGTISGSVTELTETSIGTLVIPAGKLAADDKIHYIVSAYTNDAVAGSVRVRATINSVNLEWATAGVFTARVQGIGYIQESMQATDIGIINFSGVHNATTGLMRIAEADINQANPMTKAITLNVLAAAPNSAAVTNVKVDFFKLKRSNA